MGSEGSNVKAQWTLDNHELFIELCLEQISKGNKPGSHFTAKGWRNIVDSFHSIADLKYDRIQLKNHWDTTKKHWKIWHDLISDNIMKWDPRRRIFGANELEWGEYIHDNPEAAQFRFKELVFADKLDIIFAGTEDSSPAPPAAQGPNYHRKRINCFTGSESISKQRKHNHHYPADRKHGFETTSRYLALEEPIDAIPESEHCNDVFESKNGITVQSQPSKSSYSIEECINGLDSMGELEQGGELYLSALDLFLKKEYREIFLNLKKSSTRIAWLERLHSVGPPLPLN
ncbi:hypothetical protein OROHE_014122 [Orobanche hederae]